MEDTACKLRTFSDINDLNAMQPIPQVPVRAASVLLTFPQDIFGKLTPMHSWFYCSMAAHVSILGAFPTKQVFRGNTEWKDVLEQSKSIAVLVTPVADLSKVPLWQSAKQLCMCLQVILPAVRMFLKPGKQRATDGSVVELTRLEKLYKIFERC